MGIIPLKNISTAKCNFEQLIMALNKSIQLERKIGKASTSSKTCYGQFNTHPKNIRKYDASHRNNSWNYGDYRYQQYHNPCRYKNVISKTAQDRLIASWDSKHESQIDSKTAHQIVLIAYAHQVFLTMDKGVSVGVMNISAFIHPYAPFHVLHLVEYNIHFKIANVPHHRN